MSMNLRSSKHQKGNFLLMTLGILAAISVVVVGSLGRTPAREKLTALFYHKETAFRAAESALAHAENYIDTTDFFPEDFVTDLPCVNPSQCFDPTCTDGLCATIDYSNGFECVHQEPASPLWADETIWADAARVRTATNTIPLPEDAIYLIEFLCYVPTNTAVAPPAAPPYGSGWSLLFRVTTRAKGMDGQSVSSLQTTYKKPI